MIVNICSVSSYVDLPLSAAYCASKAALLSVTNVARMELAPLGVRVMGAGARLPGILICRRGERDDHVARMELAPLGVRVMGAGARLLGILICRRGVTGCLTSLGGPLVTKCSWSSAYLSGSSSPPLRRCLFWTLACCMPEKLFRGSRCMPIQPAGCSAAERSPAKTYACHSSCNLRCRCCFVRAAAMGGGY